MEGDTATRGRRDHKRDSLDRGMEKGVAPRADVWFSRRVSSLPPRSMASAALALLSALPVSASAQETAAAPPPIPAIPGVPGLREPRTPRMPSLLPAPPGTALPGAAAAPTARKAEQIRPEFQPGSTYRFVVKTEVLPYHAAGFEMEQQIRYDAKVRVDGKPGVVLKARTERLDLTLSSRDSTLSYRSLEPGDQATPLGRHLRASLNRSADLVLDGRGRLDEAKVSAAGDASALLPGVPSFGPEELEQLVAGLSQGFPEKRIGPGDQWTLKGRRSVGGAGSVEFDILHQHGGQVNFEGQNCVLIEFSGTLAGDLADAARGEPARVQSDAVQGRIYFDPLDRMVRFSEQTVQMGVAWGEEEADSGEPVDKVPIRQTTTVRLLHVVPTL